MLLSARWMRDVTGVNSFRFTSSVEFMQGDPHSVYLQLVDEDVDDPLGTFGPGGRRYTPAAGATLEVTLTALDSAKVVTRLASQPFATDPSMWKLDISAGDPIQGTVSVKLKLTEGVTVRRGYVAGAVKVRPQGA